MRRTLQDHRAAVRELLAGHLAGAGARPVERLPLAEALGRVAAADVAAPAPLPSFDNSQMDGFAVSTADLGAGGPLLVAAPVPAGAAAAPWQPGTAVPVMTGAMIPAGADAVVPVEAADPPRFPDPRDGAARVVLPGVPAGQFIRRTGSDLAAAAVAVRAGARLTPALLGLLSATGAATVEVLTGLRVLLLSTGDEVVAAGRPLGPGKIYDANSVMLAALLREAGVMVHTAELIPDRPARFLELLAGELAAMAGRGTPAHLVLSTGGISAGAYEVVKQALAGEGVEFVSVAMQPGGPQAIGSVQGIPFLGFPGNPVSCAVSYEMFLHPVLAELAGARPRLRTTAALAAVLTSPAGKVQLRRGRYRFGGSGDYDDGGSGGGGDDDRAGPGTPAPGTPGRGTVEPVGGSSSHLLSSLAAANALIVIPAEVTEVPAGADVEVWLL
jgi:molybdopterin molybdotransferase